MKICLTTLRNNRDAGISRYVVELAERLKTENTVHIVTAKNEIPLEGISVHVNRYNSTVPSLMNGGMAIQSTLTARRLRKSGDIDLFHASGVEALSADVITCHVCYREALRQQRMEYGGLYSLLKPFQPCTNVDLLIERITMRRQNHKKIIAVSNRIRQELMRNYNVPSDDITVVYNGVNVEEFNPKNRSVYREPLRKSLGISDDDFALLFVGHEFRRKGLIPAIESLSHLDRKVKLIVVGRDRQEPYIELAQRLGVRERVIFTGHQTDVKGYYSAADALVLPSLYEPFGLIATEAMASGMPVLMTSVCGAAEIMRDGREGFYIMRDAADIAEKVQMLLDGSSKDFGSKARKTAEEYSWDRTTMETSSVYRQVLNE